MLPDVRVLSDSEQQWLKDFAAGGGRVVITGADATELGEIGECRSAGRVIRVRRTARQLRKISSMHQPGFATGVS